ncbi:hypothetical protein NL676_005830 [Syzygium grande]|nr:hypothetical protein NL676_005830 [Syzygium grande]
MAGGGSQRRDVGLKLSQQDSKRSRWIGLRAVVGGFVSSRDRSDREEDGGPRSSTGTARQGGANGGGEHSVSAGSAGAVAGRRGSCCARMRPSLSLSLKPRVYHSSLSENYLGILEPLPLTLMGVYVV